MLRLAVRGNNTKRQRSQRANRTRLPAHTKFANNTSVNTRSKRTILHNHRRHALRPAATTRNSRAHSKTRFASIRSAIHQHSARFLTLSIAQSAIK